MMLLLCSSNGLQAALTSAVYFLNVFSAWRTQVRTESCGSKVCSETSECLDEGCENVCMEAPPLYDFHTASKTGDLSRVKLLLSQGRTDINCQEWIGRTPVMWAAGGGHREVVELLVTRGAKLSLVDRSGINILHSACLGGDVEVVKYVLSQNMLDINGRVWCGRTAVMLAAANGHKDVVEMFVDKGATVSFVDEAGNNILHCACRRGDMEVVKYILSQKMVDINSYRPHKKTPVMVAAGRGDKEVVELLVKHGADLSLNSILGNILHHACYHGQFDVVKYVLSLNTVDINSRGWKKRTPVMIAAERGHKEVVELLVNHGADLSLSKKVVNILQKACYRGQLDVVEFVLSLNLVDIKSTGWKKRTPVMMAGEKGSEIEIVELLVKNRANLLLSDKHGDNALHRACDRGHLDVVKYILSLNSVDLNSTEREGRRPVMEAAESGHKDVVELLVEHGADLLLSDKHGDNTLHRACDRGHFDVVKYILSLNSVDMNSAGTEGRRPVIETAESGHKEVVELLVQHGANLLLSDKHGDNTLHRACDRGHLDVVKYILSLNLVDINSRGWEGRTPVMIAAEKGHKEVVELLLKHGANMLLRDKHGDITLHRACYGGQFDVVKYMLSLNSVDINSMGWKKRTPVMVAANHGHKEVVELMVKNEANLSLRDEDGKRILDFARQGGYLEVVQYVMSL